MQSLKVNLVLIATILLWASAFVGIKIGLMGYSPGSLALFRFLVASLCLGLVYRTQKAQKTMTWPARLGLLLGGVFGIGVYNICLNYGEISVSAGIASFVIGLMPVVTVLISVVFFKEQINAGVWIGILISLFGLLFLAWGEDVDISMQQGIVLIFISTVTGSVLSFIQERYVKDYHPITVISWVMWGGTLLLLFFLPDLWKEVKAADLQSTGAAVYMGVFPAVLAYIGWTYVLKYVSSSKASISLYALPIASTVLGFLWLNEIPSFNSLMGGGIALTGALIAHRYQEQSSLDSSLDDDDALAA